MTSNHILILFFYFKTRFAFAYKSKQWEPVCVVRADQGHKTTRVQNGQ